MASIAQGSQAPTGSSPGLSTGAGQVYEPPVVVATFAKDTLAEGLPENLTPHIHAVQSS